MRIMGAAVSFLRMQGRSDFERKLADKINGLITAEIDGAKQAIRENSEAITDPVEIGSHR